MVILSASFQARPEKREAMIAHVRELAAQSRAEAGCLRYDFYEDALAPGHFHFFELWRSREDLALHFEQPYFHAWVAAKDAFLDGPAELATYDSDGPKPAP
jgi:quinol monooxygenase YgiN